MRNSGIDGVRRALRAAYGKAFGREEIVGVEHGHGYTCSNYCREASVSQIPFSAKTVTMPISYFSSWHLIR